MYVPHLPDVLCEKNANRSGWRFLHPVFLITQKSLPKQ